MGVDDGMRAIIMNAWGATPGNDPLPSITAALPFHTQTLLSNLRGKGILEEESLEPGRVCVHRKRIALKELSPLPHARLVS